MAMTVHCDIVSAEEELFSGLVEMVVAHGNLGDIGVLPGHAPLLTALDTGVLRVRSAGGNDWTAIALMGGFAEVEEDEVTVLVNGAELGSSIDPSEAEKAYEEAQSNSNSVAADDRAAVMKANNALKKARARLQAAGGAI